MVAGILNNVKRSLKLTKLQKHEVHLHAPKAAENKYRLNDFDHALE